ncbi:MAG TPA: M4 family metallopeptidase [Thermoleophilia bacterium]|nr:M4 family metallopeptidase [Thermoleophilia bacterium]
MRQPSLEVSATAILDSDQAAALTSFGLRREQIESLRRLISASVGSVEAAFDRTVGIPTFIRAHISLREGAPGPAERGYRFFDRFKEIFRMVEPRTELRPTATREDSLETEHARFQQYFKGIPVIGAEILVHTRADGALWFVQGKYVPGIAISTTPVLQPQKIPVLVRQDFIHRRAEAIVFAVDEPQLGVLNPWVADSAFENESTLIWISHATETETGRVWTYYIDAQDGRVLSVLDSARSIDSEIWDSRNTPATADDRLWYVDNILQTISGATVDAETTNLNTFVTAYWNYLHSRFNVFSINSASTADGMQLVARARYQVQNCPNAWWDLVQLPDQAVFCPGMVERDTVSHELTHGLVEHSGGNLAYQNQSGALNESFADVFGEFLDCAAGNCTWLHRTTRDLSSPVNLGQQPDHNGNTNNPASDHPLYHDPCNPSTTGCLDTNDWGGVHTNSGVPNIFAYLLVNGTKVSDPHYGYHIKGIGISKAEQLYYRTVVDTGLPQNADFQAALQVMKTVCDDFAKKKAHGFTANDCCQVKNAWAAVGVGNGCSAYSGNVSGTCTADTSPCFVTDDSIVPHSGSFKIDAKTQLYLFPNARLKAMGLFEADGGAGDVMVLGSIDSRGMRSTMAFRLKNGGELLFPVKRFVSTDTKPHPVSLRDNAETSSFVCILKGFVVRDVNVILRITHPRVSELAVTLQSPAGTTVTLLPNAGSTGQNLWNTTFDDEAAAGIAAGTAPYTGAFRSQDNLSAFDRENARGYWRLRVRDGNVLQIGTLDDWSLEFEF